LGGSYFLWQGSQAKKDALAAPLTDNVNVTASVIPINPTISYNTITFVNSTTAVDNITINNRPTNQPITCTFTIASPSGNILIVQTQTQPTSNTCQFDPTQNPETQNAEIISGDVGQIVADRGVGTIQADIRYSNSTKTTDKIPFKTPDLIKSDQRENVNPNLQQITDQTPQSLDKNYLTPTTDVVTKANFYTNIAVGTAVVTSAYIVIFFNIITNIKIAKYRDFTEELDIFLEISPQEIYEGDAIRFVSKIYDESDKVVNNLECVLTIITPNKEKIKIKLLTNKDGKAGVYLTKDGKIDNEKSYREENLHPGEIIKGKIEGFNTTPGQGVAYLKAKLYSDRYRSKQNNWVVRHKT